MRKPVDGRVSDCIRQHIEDATDIEMNIPAKILVRQILDQPNLSKMSGILLQIRKGRPQTFFYFFRNKSSKSVTPHTQEPGPKE